MTLPPLLTARLMNDFQASLQRAGFPDSGRLGTGAGLTSAEMDELTQPLGLRLSTEALAWWSYVEGADGALVGPYRTVCSLARVVDHARHMRSIDATTRSEGFRVWADELLPILNSQTVYGCDCSVEPGAPSPVWAWEPSDAEPLEGPSLPSFGSLITLWTRALDEAVIQFRPDEGVAVFSDDAFQRQRWPHGLP